MPAHRIATGCLARWVAHLLCSWGSKSLLIELCQAAAAPTAVPIALPALAYLAHSWVETAWM